ncbi:diaminopimelate decarboxylase family protein [Nannocystis pusilla]|uniref:diaminopimelate decarboxylase family protein n=1 Tax=Nannocystis pusilla TaxID=889268 RepID=UPI003B7ED557
MSHDSAELYRRRPAVLDGPLRRRAGAGVRQPAVRVLRGPDPREHRRAAVRLFPALPAFDIMYASKACANLAVLDVVRRAGCGVEINSGGELYKALRTGFAPAQIVFNGVSKSTAEVEFAVETGIHSLNVDSLAELERIIAVAGARGLQAGVTLRLVPSVMGGTVAGFETGHAGSKFGMLVSELDAAAALLSRHAAAVRFRGFHFHVGSQVVNPAAFADGLEVVLRAAVELHARTGLKPECINMGGGFPIPLVPDGQLPTHRDGSRLPPALEQLLLGQLSLAEVAARTAAVWDRTAGDVIPRHATRVLIEPGRRVVGDAGLLLTRIESRKTRRDGAQWLMIDAGFNTLPETLWYDWYYHAVSATRHDCPHDAPFRLGGPLCDTGDSQHDERGTGKLPDVRRLPAATAVGDVLAVLGAGAYAIEQQNNYNGRPRAAAILLRGAEVVPIARRETYSDLVARELWP